MSAPKLVYSLQSTAIRLFLFFIFLLSTIYYLPSTIYAQTPSTRSTGSPPTSSGQADSSSTTSANPVIRPLGIVTPQSPQFINLQVINFMHSISCLVVGFSPINQPCVGYISENVQGTVNTIPVLSSVNSSDGVLGITTKGLSLLYTSPPIRSIDYLGSVWDRLDLFNIKEAHAQVGGSGNAVLYPVLTLWQVSRNIAYIVMIIIFVVIGVMVMMRNRINPQTVVTVQAALPGLVIGLILITFSYFLASLLTDIAFVGSNIVGHYFTIAQGQPIPVTGPVERLEFENVLSIISRFISTARKEDAIPIFHTIFDNLPVEPPTDLFGPAHLFTYLIVGMTTQLVGLLGLPGVISAVTNTYTGTNGLANPEATGAFFIFLVLTLVLMYSMFKILYRLVVSYLTIIFLTFSAPFTFLMASFPGRQADVTSWIRNMLANVLAFPGVLAMFYFAAYLMPTSVLAAAAPGRAGGLPLEDIFNIHNSLTITGGGALPLLGGLNQGTLQLILAYGALIAAPAIPDIIMSTIGKPSQAGQALGREITGAVTAGRGYLERGAGAVGGAFRGGRR